MKFECGDLERALATPELMPEAREHVKECAACRRELWLWNQISSIAPELREDWESPELWPRIREALAAEPRTRKTWRPGWRLCLAAAAVVVVALGLLRPWQRSSPATDRDFLTEQTLHEVEQSEVAYRQSIDKLSHLAETKLANTNSPLASSYREKLLVLDSAIADVRSNAERNRFNARLQTELATLYQDKKKTLQELLTP